MPNQNLVNTQNESALQKFAFELDKLCAANIYIGAPPWAVPQVETKQTTYTPPEVAKKLRKSPDYILASIRRGELKASNLSKGKRPRYIITQSALDDFLSGKQPEKPETRKRNVIPLPTNYRRYSA